MNKILGLFILIICGIVLHAVDFIPKQNTQPIIQDKIIYYLPKRDEELDWLLK